MRLALFCHSIRSCWNHGNAHFLRGVVESLLRLGHDVRIFEPRNGWSSRQLVGDHGAAALTAWRRVYPQIPEPVLYPGDGEDLDLGSALDGVEVAWVHEWTSPQLIRRIAAHRRARGDYVLLFHDTHHRAVSRPAEMESLDLEGFDGALVFGAALAEVYETRGWVPRVFVWHEAADTRVFRPRTPVSEPRDLVWIGNFGDEERTRELEEMLIEPVNRLGITAQVFGVRYPPSARAALAKAGIQYRGWLPNHRVPEVFAGHRVTVHVPRRPYARSLPGIPTIRVFEALACGIPLVSAPWTDSEGLFRPGEDFLVAEDGPEMERQIRRLLEDSELSASIAASGRARVLERHTCDHRAKQLLDIVEGLRSSRPRTSSGRRHGGAESNPQRKPGREGPRP